MCSILGVPTVTYKLTRHAGARVSGDPALRTKSYQQFLAKHHKLFEAHPVQYADFVYAHALRSFRQQPMIGFSALIHAARLAPRRTLRRTVRRVRASLFSRARREKSM